MATEYRGGSENDGTPIVMRSLSVKQTSQIRAGGRDLVRTELFDMPEAYRIFGTLLIVIKYDVEGLHE